MEFYHVLPSNTSPETFPNNNASSFSTPIYNPYNLEGDWEVGVVGITHSNCINTFNNDYITVKDSSKTISQWETHVKIPYTISTSTKKITDDVKYRKAIVKELNQLLKDIVTFKLIRNGRFIEYSFLTNKFAIVLNKPLSDFFRILDVLTPDDSYSGNYYSLNGKANQLDSAECIITLIRYDKPDLTFLIKKANVRADVKNIIENFKTNVTDVMPVKFHLIEDGNHLVLTKPESHKFFDVALTFSKSFHVASSFRSNGLNWKTKNRFLAHDFSKSFKDEYAVNMYFLHKIKIYTSEEKYRVTLPPKMFQSPEQVCQYLTNVINKTDIKFVDKVDKVQLDILSDAITMEMSDDVRDILGFQRNIYKGKGQYLSNSTISLTRSINFLYIYSNVGSLVRVGDTEAAVLAVLPFNPKSCDIMTELNFRYPMYVKVSTKDISQIDIKIYDGAGVLVPFHRDAVTNIRLHFRKL